MNDTEFSYDITVQQTGLTSVKLPSHFIACLVADKLGLPTPNRNKQCEVRASEQENKQGEDHMVNIDFEYLDRVETAPVKLTLKANATTPP